MFLNVILCCCGILQESLQNQLSQPSLVIADLANIEAPANLHLGFLALHQFNSTYSRLPNLW